jgi:hypothetical protein
MSHHHDSKNGPPKGQKWAKALDVAKYNEQLAAAWKYVRVKICRISLMEAERRSDVTHQFWAKVEKGLSHPSTATDLLMCNALRIRPSVIHRLAERWTLLGRKLKEFLIWLLPLEEGISPLLLGV